MSRSPFLARTRRIEENARALSDLVERRYGEIMDIDFTIGFAIPERRGCSVHVALTNSERAALKRHAGEHGTKVSTLIRAVLTSHRLLSATPEATP